MPRGGLLPPLLRFASATLWLLAVLLLLLGGHARAAQVPASHVEGSAEDRIALERAELNRRRQEAVRAEMQHAWAGYREHAWGYDTLKPVSREGVDDFGGFGATIVDSLDTLWLMGLREDYEAGLAWVRDHLEFGRQENVNLFEVTIRILGGLLGAYAQSGDCVLLSKAHSLGRSMLFAFDTPTGLPLGTIGLESGIAWNPQWALGASSLAEVATLSLELNYLSVLTGDPVFAERVQRIAAWQAQFPGFLYPMYVHPETGAVSNRSPVTMGGRIDSAYEYVGKSELLLRSARADWLDLPQYLAEVAAAAEEAQVCESGDHDEHDDAGDVDDLQRDSASDDAVDADDDAEPPQDVCVSPVDPLLQPGYQAMYESLYDRLISGMELILLANTPPAASPTSAATAVSPVLPGWLWLRLGAQHGLDYPGQLREQCPAIRATRTRACNSLCHLGIRPADEPAPGEEGTLWYLVELLPQQMTFDHKMDHLACFVPGMLALGASLESVVEASTRKRHMELAERLAETCAEFYFRMPTGLSPEIVRFEPAAARTASFPRLRPQAPPPDPASLPERQFFADPGAKHSLLRPETLESLFVLYRTTGDPKYQEWGWRIFESLRRYGRVPGGGYSGLKDVTRTAPDPETVCPCATSDPREEDCACAASQDAAATVVSEEGDAFMPREWSNRLDEMPSFLLAETFKYLWLLFSPPEVLPLEHWVFNTEAHAFPLTGTRVGSGAHCLAGTAAGLSSS